jgi:hypothetical protein
LFPINHGPLVERTLRSPWKDTNNDGGFLMLELRPTSQESPRFPQGRLDEGDSIQEGEVYEGDFDPDKNYGSDLEAFTIHKVRKDPHIYHRDFKKGLQSGETPGGVEIIGESLMEYTSNPEDQLTQKERREDLFTSEIFKGSENLLSKVMGENSSLVKEFIQPIIPALNKTIENLNGKHDFPLYNVVNPGDTVSNLLYKMPLEKTSSRKELKDNLTPLILSPTLCAFRGHRGFIEDTFVVAKTKEDWKAYFFEPNRKSKLSDRIDIWLEEISQER